MLQIMLTDQGEIIRQIMLTIFVVSSFLMIIGFLFENFLLDIGVGILKIGCLMFIICVFIGMMIAIWG